MTRKEWNSVYRAYRIECKLADQLEYYPEPNFPIPTPLTAKGFRHKNIVINTKTGDGFTVKEWPGKTTDIDWLSGEWLDNRWVGHYLLMGAILKEVE